MTHLHTKMVPCTLSFLLCALVLLPHPAHALVVQGAIGVSLFNSLMGIIMFIILPIAAIGVGARLIGARKTSNNTWAFDLKRALLQGIKYISYHSVLIGGWMLVLDLQDIIFTGNGRTAPPFAHEHIFQLIIYTSLFAIAVPWLMYGIQKLFKNHAYPPTFTNHVRLCIWNIVIFFFVYQFIAVFLF